MGQGTDADFVIRRRVLGCLVLAEIDAKDAPPSAFGSAVFRQPPRHGSRAGIVESHTVEDGLRLAQPEQTRLRIAALGQWRDAADLGKTKAKTQDTAPNLGILVKASRETDWVAEVQTEAAYLRDWIGLSSMRYSMAKDLTAKRERNRF